MVSIFKLRSGISEYEMRSSSGSVWFARSIDVRPTRCSELDRKIVRVVQEEAKNETRQRSAMRMVERRNEADEGKDGEEEQEQK